MSWPLLLTSQLMPAPLLAEPSKKPVYHAAKWMMKSRFLSIDRVGWRVDLEEEIENVYFSSETEKLINDLERYCN